MNPLSRWSAAALLVASPLAQPPPSTPPVEEPARRAVEAWLEEPTRVEIRERATEAVLDAGRPALLWLGSLLQGVENADPQGPDGSRRRALESLTAAVALGYVERVQESGMVYAGQYADLRALQPHVGNLYLNLLLATPDWFAEQRRALLVPALRDLFPTSPGAAVLREVRDCAENEDLESWDLRVALFCALAQWGDRELIDRYLEDLRARVSRAGVEDRIEIDRTLARTQHLLRDHAAAARTYRQLLRAAEAQAMRVPPGDYYNAACNMSLAGDLEAALDELARCVALLRSGEVDSSQELERKLFERDPELANVRKTERFAQLLAAAFADGKDESSKSKQGKSK